MATDFDINNFNRKDIFKVPDNYFETLTQRVMDNIPSEGVKVVDINSQTTQKSHAKWWGAGIAAAASIALIFGVTTFFSNGSTDDADTLAQTSAASTVNGSYDEMDEDAIAYSMVDNQDVYAYLAGEY